ncbi:hypothetical protein TWF694_011680 [Orbilia ellipsospora]|uniref:Uncharacterized protein n=1 Tax=Orbilia ellipsospora TaxID=2528407 RepID=A0AAV9X755_9PEZI
MCTIATDVPNPNPTRRSGKEAENDGGQNFNAAIRGYFEISLQLVPSQNITR